MQGDKVASSKKVPVLDPAAALRAAEPVLAATLTLPSRTDAWRPQISEPPKEL